jgi:hypothetical protein
MFGRELNGIRSLMGDFSKAATTLVFAWIICKLVKQFMISSPFVSHSLPIHSSHSCYQFWKMFNGLIQSKQMQDLWYWVGIVTWPSAHQHLSQHLFNEVLSHITALLQFFLPGLKDLWNQVIWDLWNHRFHFTKQFLCMGGLSKSKTHFHSRNLFPFG